MVSCRNQKFLIKNLEEKDSDLKDWQKFLEEPGNIHNKDNDETIDSNSNKKFKFDFHGYTIEKANLTIEKIISKCYENGVNEILVITGKGIHSKDNDVYNSTEYNKLKNTIPLFIKNEPSLSSKIKNIKTAPNDKGGEGALIIKLKKSIK